MLDTVEKALIKNIEDAVFKEEEEKSEETGDMVYKKLISLPKEINNYIRQREK